MTSRYGCVVPPIHLSSTYNFTGFNEPRAHDYSRRGNPTRDVTQRALAELEGGAGAVLTIPACLPFTGNHGVPETRRFAGGTHTTVTAAAIVCLIARETWLLPCAVCRSKTTNRR